MKRGPGWRYRKPGYFGKQAATTRPAKDRHPVPDLVDRDFSAGRPDQLCVAHTERHEALLYRVVVKGHRLQSVVAG